MLLWFKSFLSIVAVDTTKIYLKRSIRKKAVSMYIYAVLFAAVFGISAGTNIALRKPAFQSSTKIRNQKAYSASFAVDGNNSTDVEYCSSTRYGAIPWFMIDFGKVETVHRFRLTAAKDCNNCELKDFEVYIGNKAGKPVSNQLCVRGGVGEGLSAVFTCKKKLEGRYFYVYLPEGYSLVICELEVYSNVDDFSETQDYLRATMKNQSYDGNKAKCNFIAFHQDYTTWCINTNNQIYVQKKGTWDLVPGEFSIISVGHAGVWALTPKLEVFYRQGVSCEKPEGLSWTKAEGKMVHITSAVKGVVWAVTERGQIMYRDMITCSNPMGLWWEKVEDRYDALWVSCNVQGCWVLYKNGDLQFRTNVTATNPKGSSWTRVSYDKGFEMFKSIESSYSGKRVVATTVRFRVFVWNGQYARAEWTEIGGNDGYTHAVPAHMGYIATQRTSEVTYIVEAPRCNISRRGLDQIDAGKDNSVCGVHEGVIYQKQGRNWVRMDGSLEQVSCSEHQMWGIDHYNEIYFRTSTNCSNPYGSGWKKVKGTLKHIDVGNFGSVYGTDFNDRIIERKGITQDKPEGEKWVTVPGRLARVSCHEGNCWGTDFRQTVHMKTMFRGECKDDEFQAVDGLRMRRVEVGEDGQIFAISKENRLFMRMGVTKMNPMGSEWIEMYTGMTEVSTNRKQIYPIDLQRRAFICTFQDY